jgi:hypothetical protein
MNKINKIMKIKILYKKIIKSKKNKIPNKMTIKHFVFNIPLNKKEILKLLDKLWNC